jgi:hypothetical protein
MQQQMRAAPMQMQQQMYAAPMQMQAAPMQMQQMQMPMGYGASMAPSYAGYGGYGNGSVVARPF